MWQPAFPVWEIRLLWGIPALHLSKLPSQFATPPQPIRSEQRCLGSQWERGFGSSASRNAGIKTYKWWVNSFREELEGGAIEEWSGVQPQAWPTPRRRAPHHCYRRRKRNNPRGKLSVGAELKRKKKIFRWKSSETTFF